MTDGGRLAGQTERALLSHDDFFKLAPLESPAWRRISSVPLIPSVGRISARRLRKRR